MAGKFSLNGLLNAVSKIISEEEPVKRGKAPQQKAHDDEIQNAILVLAADVIRCNRNYTGDTENFIHQYLTKHFGHNGVNAKMKTVNDHIDIGSEPFLKMACRELTLLTTPQSRLSIVNFLFGVAAADDFVNTKEITRIHRIAGYLGIAEKEFKELKYAFTSNNSPYSVLGLDETASFAQVKVAYRKMVLKYHPDKRNERTSETEASLKFREVQRAFEIIKQNQP